MTYQDMKNLEKATKYLQEIQQHLLEQAQKGAIPCEPKYLVELVDKCAIVNDAVLKVLE